MGMERVKTTACKNNMKGLAVTQSGYISEHNGRFTPNYPHDNGKYGDLSNMQWDGLLGYGNYDGRSLSEGAASNRVDATEENLDLHSMYICPNDTVVGSSKVTRSYSLNHKSFRYRNWSRGIAEGASDNRRNGNIHSLHITSLRDPSQNIINSQD